jgi:hypothetical protein
MQSSFETTLLVAIMSPTLNQAQLLSAFISTLSANKTPTILPTLYSTSLFLQSVGHHAGRSPALSCAVRAVSLSYLGRQVSDQNLIRLSRQTYRQALLTLNAALQDPMDGLSSSTLAATILLSFYEVINCTERDSWVRHAGGAGHLMRLRGPSRHLTGFGRDAFLAYRHSLVIEAFLSQNATFLAVQPWLDLCRSIQSSLAPADRTPISDLVSDFHLLIVEIPGFVQAATDTNASLSTKKKLLTTGLAYRGNLHVWCERFMTTLDETDMQIITYSSVPPDPIFPQSYRFPSLEVGSLLCGYNAVLTILNRNLALLEESLAPLDDLSSRIGTGNSDPTPSRYHLRNAPEDSAGYAEENLAKARASCMAVEGLSTSAFLGPLYLIFALRVAYIAFEEGEERMWVVGKLERLGEHLGIARRLLDDGKEPEGGAGRGGAIASASQSHSQSQSATGSAEVSRRPSLQRQQQGMSREVSREGGGGAGMGVSLQELEVERVSSGGSRSRPEETGGKGKGKGKGVMR